MEPLSPEELLQQYENLDSLQQERISKILKKESRKSSRHKKGPKVLTHKALGRLVFEFPDNNNQPIPIHHMHVELWDRDTGNPDDFLGSGLTNKEGYFEIYYDPEDAGSFDHPDLELRIFEETHRFDNSGQVRNKKKLIFSFKGDDNVTSQSYNFGVCMVPYWEYDTEAVTPRLLITEEGDAPEAYSPGRGMLMVKVVSRIEAQKRLHFAADKLLTIQAVQKAYPINKTQQKEAERKRITRSDEYFGKALLNGMAAAIMDRDKDHPDWYRIYYHWNSYEQDGIYAMPNVDIRLSLTNDKLLPVQIELGMRKPGSTAPNAPVEKMIFHPEDGEKWEQAKRIARVSSSLSAELDAHLCATHLNAEQYAIAARRNIRKNPVRFLLFPHIKEVCIINNSANSLLLGKEGYITRSTGFVEDSINQRIRQSLGTLDWKHWEPRAAISKHHYYAHASRLFWDVLTEFIDWYFAAYDEEIRNEWFEIKCFSDDLVEHAVPDFFCRYLKSAFGNLTKKDIPWMDWNERIDIDVPRAHNRNHEVAVSEITNVDHDPEKQDIANLKQVCRYVIHHTTFVHSWSNSQQFDEGGELRYTSLGLRYGKNGLFVDEEDDSILPPPKDASMQLWISYMLSNANFGYILSNEERDIHPKFIEILKTKKEAFLKIHPGLDIAKIPSRTNI